VNLSAIVLRRREPDLKRLYRMPLYPFPAIFALLVNLGFLAAFLYESPVTVFQASALVLLLAGTAYLSTRRTSGIVDRAIPGAA
jgi:amino acid transporter